jgi:hypothetical protein
MQLQGVIARSLFGLAVLAACSDQGPMAVTPCAQSVIIQVSTGLQPTIQWAPACGATALAVVEVGAPRLSLPIWWIESFLSVFPPPVKYGSPPRGATVTVDPTPLTAGTIYTVYVTRGLRGQIAGTDSLTFTAQ